MVKKSNKPKKQLKKIRRTKKQGIASFKKKLFSGLLKILQPWKYHPKITFYFLVLTAFLEIAFYLVIVRDLPSPYILQTIPSPASTIIRDKNGVILYRVYKDANRTYLSWQEIPEAIKQATVAIEDSDFYHHPGISLKAIFRAFLNNLQEKEVNNYQGGSTITQQLVRNKLLSFEKTYQRKLKEVVLSLLAERIYSKEEILTMYLNEIGYGGPAYGIEAASQMYFGLPTSELSLSQAALLAGLPAAPTTFSPFGANSGISKIRQHQVLERMSKLGMISADQYSSVLNEPLNFAPQLIDIKAPHFVMYVRDQLVKKFGEEMITQGGLDVITTLDLNIQHQAEDIIQNQLNQISKKYRINNASTLVTSPGSGEILAMVGSANYFDNQNHGHVNVTTSLRQPGSAIKPVNYAYAFDHGFTPSSTLEDAPVVYSSPGIKERYAPVNYDGKFHGTVTLRSALANSYNVPAVKLLNSYGVDKMLDLGRKMGINNWENLPPIGLSLTLGGAEVTMLDMATIYGTIANGGLKKDLIAIKEIRNSSRQDLTNLFYEGTNNAGVIEPAHASESKQVISPLAAFWISDILADNLARLPAFGRYAKLTIPKHKVAVKTGTSNNFRDNWTIGFTPDYLVVSWVGNNDGSFMNRNLVSGITGAAPIWNETMSYLLEDKTPKEFKIPQGLIPVKICAIGGLLTCPNCPLEKIEYFTADRMPTKKCFFRSITECEETRKQTEGKSEEEKKQILSGCPITNNPPQNPTH